MSTSTIILEAGTNGDAQVTPQTFPTTVRLTFEPQAAARLFYGLDGAAPTIPVAPGTLHLDVRVNSLQLRYEVESGAAKIEWEL